MKEFWGLESPLFKLGFHIACLTSHGFGRTIIMNPKEYVFDISDQLANILCLNFLFELIFQKCLYNFKGK